MSLPFRWLKPGLPASFFSRSSEWSYQPIPSYDIDDMADGEKILDTSSTASQSPAQSPPPPTTRRRKSRKSLLIIIGVVAVVCAAALIIPLAVVFSRRRSHPDPDYVPPPDINETLTSPWSANKFKTLFAFGDSYTDEGRVDTIGYQNQTPQPAGFFANVSTDNAIGGYVWPRYVNWYTGAQMYDYAVGGAVCSTAIVDGVGVGVQEYQIPTFLRDQNYRPGGKPLLNFSSDDTVFSLWIGTNDFGVGGFLTDSNVDGTNPRDYIDCVYLAFDKLYAAGARKFVLMSLVPLEKTPLFALPENGGVQWSQYWRDKSNYNATEKHFQMSSMVNSTNAQFINSTSVFMNQKTRYPAARIAYFDTWSLFNDIYNHPSSYLNGTLPPNVTSSVVQLFEDGTQITSLSPDSWMWYDDLHPTEQTERHLAMEFVKVVSGNSSYAKYWP